jgi:hypothetical protein
MESAPAVAAVVIGLNTSSPSEPYDVLAFVPGTLAPL